MKKNENLVSIFKSNTYTYPDADTCFCPDENYPENPFKDRVINSNNKVYKAVREALHLLKMDEDNYGTSNWNPFKDVINLGDTVLIKPNLVMHENTSGEGTDCLYTQPSVVAPVIDYVAIALKGTGKIIIGDAPMQECNFNELSNNSGFSNLLRYYKSKNLNIDMIDFREIKSVVKHGLRIQEKVKDSAGLVIDLGNDSEFRDIDSEMQKRMRITNYDPGILNQHHTIDKHEYYITKEVFDADVIINMPKPKTHRKGGVTISLKNLIGVNTRKEFLPHHTVGSKQEGGDEYLRKNKVHKLMSYLEDEKNILVANGKINSARCISLFSRILGFLLRNTNESYFEGSWYGNNTISKTISDINKIVLYSDKYGVMQSEKQRKVFIVADMIVSGEKEGPVLPSSKNVGIIAAAYNPVIFDEAIATLMGFDYNKIPAIVTARNIPKPFKLVNHEEAIIISNDSNISDITLKDFPESEMLNFVPTTGWQGHIEKHIRVMKE